MMSRLMTMLTNDDDHDDAALLVSGACGPLFRRKTTDHRLRQAELNRRRLRNQSGFAELGRRQRLFLFQLINVGQIRWRETFRG